MYNTYENSVLDWRCKEGMQRNKVLNCLKCFYYSFSYWLLSFFSSCLVSLLQMSYQKEKQCSKICKISDGICSTCRCNKKMENIVYFLNIEERRVKDVDCHDGWNWISSSDRVLETKEILFMCLSFFF